MAMVDKALKGHIISYPVLFENFKMVPTLNFVSI